MSDGRRYDDGDTIKLASGREMLVTGVSYQETDGRKHAFSYTVRDKEDVEKEEAAEKKRIKEAEDRAAKEAAEAEDKAE